jgi:hypothetical protein
MNPRDRRRKWRVSDRGVREKPAVPGLDYEDALAFESEEAKLTKNVVAFYKKKMASKHSGLANALGGNVEAHVAKLLKEKSLEEMASLLLQMYGEVPRKLAAFVDDDAMKENELNKRKLIEFYKEYDPVKANEKCVERLLRKYTLSKIQRGLRKKYNADLDLVNAEAKSVLSIGPSSSDASECGSSFSWRKAKTTAGRAISPFSRGPWGKRPQVHAGADEVDAAERFRLDSPGSQYPNLDGSQPPTPTLLKRGEVYYSEFNLLPEERNGSESKPLSVSSSVSVGLARKAVKPSVSPPENAWGGDKGGSGWGEAKVERLWGDAPDQEHVARGGAYREQEHVARFSPAGQAEAFPAAGFSLGEVTSLPITWTNVTGEHFMAESTAEYRMQGALEKLMAAEDGSEAAVWDSGASSVETICWSRPNLAQGVRWVVAADGAGYAIGLSHEDADVDLQSIDCALWCHAYGHLAVFESGEGKGTFGKYNTGDVLAVKVEGDTVSYWCNDTLLYTSQQQPAFPLVVDSSFSSPGARAEALTLIVAADSD